MHARSRWLPEAILAVAAAGVYLPSLSNGFVWDDALQIQANPWIRDFRHFGDIFSTHVWAFAGRESNYYRPFMHVVYALVYVPFGPWPAAFRAVNILLHVAATLLVFRLCRRFVPEDDASAGAPFPLASFIAALLFAVHPVHVEAVAWISGLPDLAVAVFWLTGLLAFCRASDTPRDATPAHIAGSVAFLCAALFKEPGVTLPAAVAVLDLARWPFVRSWRFWLSRYGTLAAATAAYAILRWNAIGGVVPHASESAIGFTGALDVAGTAAWRYVAMVFVPHNLNAFQTLATSTAIPSSFAVLFPIALAVALIRRSLRWTAVLTLFVVPLLPALYAPALLPGLDNPWAERYVYLPSAGFALALAIAVVAASPTRSRGGWIVCVAALPVVLVSAALTHARIPVWRDDLTLWRDTAAKSPSAGAAHGALGYALFVSGNVDGAISEYRTALRLKPDHADSWTNLGVALATRGLHADAVAAYREGIRLQPRRGVLRANLAISLSNLGQHEDALSEARLGVEQQGGLAVTWQALGVALGNAGRVAEAADAFRRALALDPDDARNRENLERAEAILRGR